MEKLSLPMRSDVSVVLACLFLECVESSHFKHIMHKTICIPNIYGRYSFVVSLYYKSISDKNES